MTTGSRTGLVLVLALAMTAQSHAQAAEAEALFREGKRLMKAGDIEAACDKFEASERLEPENGTELNLADCWERVGRTASAWAMFVKAAASAKREDRAAEARSRAAILEKKLVYLTIEVPTESELDDLVITRNDQVVDRGLWNQAAPVDPDEYTITAEADKRETWSTQIKVKTKHKVVVIPVLERAPRKKKKKKAPEGVNENRSLALALGISGGGAIVVASGFAIHSYTLQDRSDAVCPTTACRDAGAVDLNRRARLEGWVASIGWGLGVAAVGAAIVAWSIGGKKATEVSLSPVITDERAGLVLGGQF